MKTLRIGAVGLGRLGRYHAETIAFFLPGVELSAVCSISDSELIQAEQELGQPRPFNDFSEMIQKGNLDAVVLSSPSYLHCAQIVEALDAGLHVFCEKPLGTTLKECQSAAAAVDAHPDQVFMLGFMRRYDPSYLFAKKEVDAGRIGRIVLFRSYSVDPVSAIEGALRFAPQSAGQFLDMAIHDIDLARWFIGTEPENLFAVGGCFSYPEFAQYNDGDNVAALMQFENRAMAFFLAGRTAPHGYNVETEIIGTKATLRIGAIPQANHVEILDAHGVRRLCTHHFIERFGEAYKAELIEFISCIREARQPEVTVHDGLAATRIALDATGSFHANSFHSR